MKRLILMALAALLAGGSMTASAQNRREQQAAPPVETREELAARERTLMNHYTMEIRMENWGVAAHYLHEIMNIELYTCPQLFDSAVEMYNKRATAATDPAEKKMLADSLIMMYDMFIHHYADKYPDRIYPRLTNRAVAVQRHFGDDPDRVLEAFRFAADRGGAAAPRAVVGYFYELTARYSRDEVSAESYLAEYDRLDAMLAEADAESDESYRQQLEQIFVESGAADCEAIEKMYAPRIAEQPGDAALLDRTIALMNRANCKGDFFLSVAEKYYQVKPSSKTALIIALAYRTKGDNATANNYNREALALADTPEEKADIQLSIAAYELTQHNYGTAYGNAREALAINPQSVEANYIMGLSLASSAGICSDPFVGRTVLWLAYDRMMEARRLAVADPDPENAGLMRDIDSNVARFQMQFPSAEDLFFQDMKEGAAYTVNCGWISGRTTVRRRP